mgnify:CR=1 FL=1
MLDTLHFQLHAPTALIFLSSNVHFAGLAHSKTALLAHYLTELALLEYGMLGYRPSLVGAAALYLALETLASPAAVTPWTEALASHSGYSVEALQPVVRELHAVHKAARSSSLQAVLIKYGKEVRAWPRAHASCPLFLTRLG